MNKKQIGIACVLILLLVGLSTAYYQLRFKHLNKSAQQISAFIPMRTALVLEVNELSSFASKLRNSSIIWADLIDIPFWDRINDVFKELEQNKEGIKEVVVTATQISGKSFGFTTFIRFAYEPTLNDLQQLSTFKTIEVQEKYGAIDLHKVVQGKETLYYFIREDIGVISAHLPLLKEAIDTQKGFQNITHDKGYVQAHQYAGKDLDGNIFINFAQVPILFREAITNEASDKLELFKQVGNWIALDLMLKPNYINCNGFLTSEDSTTHFLNLLEDQVPIRQKITEIIPKQTAFFCAYGFSDMPSYMKRLSPKEVKQYGLRLETLTEAFGKEQALLLISPQPLSDYKKAAIFSVADPLALEKSTKHSLYKQKSVMLILLKIFLKNQMY